MRKITRFFEGLLILAALVFLLSMFPFIRVPQTVQFDYSLSFTEIGGYKYHTEIFGKPNSTPVIVVHGGPGLDFEYLKPLKNLSNQYRVVFYDQRGTGLSPRVDKKDLTLEKSRDDLRSIVEHFSDGGKVKLIGHSWGGNLVTCYLSKYPESVSQAVIVEPPFLDAHAAKEFASKAKLLLPSIWKTAPYFFAYPFVRKEDGHEGFDYGMTQIANQFAPGPPYNCEGQDLPPGIFRRAGYEAFNTMTKPTMENPESFTNDLTDGLSEYRGGLMLISSECSIIGSEFQNKFHVPKLPAQTVHIRAARMGHHMMTLNPDWSLETIASFFNHRTNAELK